MLAYYSERFPTTEINYSFYRIPNIKTLEKWADGTPERFVFSLKAPKRITHDAKLQGCEELLGRFIETVNMLGPKLGVVLFQLPPAFKKNAEVLAAFLALLPPGFRSAFEFRHPSWHDPEIFALLENRDAALCIAESDKLAAPVVATAGYGYLRLRREDYIGKDIERWAGVIAEYSARWKDIFVYYKHEEKGMGPMLARQLMDALRVEPRLDPTLIL
jgi:uncharacterized protein YecE (DUF72 family)